MKGKWLAIGAALLVAMLVALWHSVGATSAMPASPPPPDEPAPAPTRAPLVARRAAPAPAPAPDEPAAPAKLDPMSDEFFNQFIDLVPHRISRDVAECYTKPGLLHRNQKLVLTFNVQVRDGVVTVHDVRIKPDDPSEPENHNNTLNNPALESCFIQKVARATWRNDALPDYDWPDELVIRPERGLKKYWKSNLEYVGAEMPEKR